MPNRWGYRKTVLHQDSIFTSQCGLLVSEKCFLVLGKHQIFTIVISKGLWKDTTGMIYTFLFLAKPYWKISFLRYRVWAAHWLRSTSTRHGERDCSNPSCLKWSLDCNFKSVVWGGKNECILWYWWKHRSFDSWHACLTNKWSWKCSHLYRNRKEVWTVECSVLLYVLWFHIRLR